MNTIENLRAQFNIRQEAGHREYTEALEDMVARVEALPRYWWDFGGMIPDGEMGIPGEYVRLDELQAALKPTDAP